MSRKPVLAVAGLLMSLVFLECGMRLGNYFLLREQRKENAAQVRESGTCRILCIGESTTRRQYPRFLEEALNRGNTGIRFSVIDEGIGGTNSSALLERLPSQMMNYRPQIVVAMVGVNDGGYYNAVYERKRFYTSLRLYRLARLIWMHATGGGPEIRQPETVRNATIPDAMMRGRRPVDESLDAIGRRMRQPGEGPQAERELLQLAAACPEEGRVNIELAALYTINGNPAGAEAMVRAALEKGIRDPYACFRAADRMFGFGNGANICLLIDRLLRERPAVAAEGWPWFYVGKARGIQRNYPAAETALRRSLEIDPDNTEAWQLLGEACWMQRRTAEAEQAFREGLRRYPGSLPLAAMTGAFYLDTGRPELAEKYFRKTDAARALTCNYITYHNYRAMMDIAAGGSALMVCMQYPVRSAEPLRRLVASGDGMPGDVIVVDNEKVFKDALRREGYDALFVDRFGGDFGHCTDRGNRLIAENLARHILARYASDARGAGSAAGN